MARCLFSLAAALLSTSADASVLVTGATGHTGSLIYNRLRQDGADVRAFVRNATKARERLNCSACDASEGIFVGDIGKPKTLTRAMEGISTLVIATAAAQVCNWTTFDCHYPDGGWPVDVEWNGGRNQIAAFGNATKGSSSSAHVVLLSTALTTLEKVLNVTRHPGYVYHYKLNLEAALMASGLGFTIIQPCGLTNDQDGKKQLLTSHDDEQYPFPSGIARADVARIAAEAVREPAVSRGLRFDVCAAVDGEPTGDKDLQDLLLSARYSWQQVELRV